MPGASAWCCWRRSATACSRFSPNTPVYGGACGGGVHCGPAHGRAVHLCHVPGWGDGDACGRVPGPAGGRCPARRGRFRPITPGYGSGRRNVVGRCARQNLAWSCNGWRALPGAGVATSYRNGGHGAAGQPRLWEAAVRGNGRQSVASRASVHRGRNRGRCLAIC